MKKSIYIVFIFSVLFSVSCKKDLDQINTNPNSPLEVQPSLLLRQVIYNYGEEMSYEGFVAGNLLGQYLTAIDFNLFDRHSLSEPQFGGNPWPVFYSNLRDNQMILNQANSESIYEVYSGPSMILKAYMTAALTDIYGDVPFSESLQGLSGNVTPSYDSQEDIYTSELGILDLLDKGIQALENYSAPQSLEGDILFNGNLQSWIKFANTLKVKYLIRISEKVDVSAELQSIYDSMNYMQFNTDNATYDFSDGQPNNFRMATLRQGDFNLFIMSETMEEILMELNDPRMQVLFRPTGNDPMVYAGLLNGPDASQTSISVADYSLAGTVFRENTGALDANFMTAWECQFLLAEAAQRGLISADPQSHYDAGVQLCFDYWLTEMPADYLLDGPGSFAFDGADPLEQIITQKWLGNIINGYEGWIEYRRTGFPELKTIDASLNGGLIPVRMPYPTDEAALNSSSYNAATSINGNSINFPVWWDED